MRNVTTAIGALTILVCLTLCAQETQRPADGGLAERFKQLDKNGDGRVAREEATQLPMFDQWDANKDGALTLEEVTAFYARRRAASKAADMPAKPTPASNRNVPTDGFVPDAPFVGAVNGSYIDPEFSEAASQVVFQDIQNRVWVGDIDPETGMFRTATGRDYLIDENITLIFDRPPQGRKFSTNGPEWTRDAQGHCVVYTKADKAGIMQQWLARLVDGRSVVTQLTHNTFDCYGNMPSRFQDGKPPRVAYTYDWPIWKAKAAWVFADQPDEPHHLDDFDYRQMSMWSAVSPDFLFVKHPPGAPFGQIARANADTGRVTMLTDDEGEKNDPGLFLAPELGGEMLLVCNVDNSALGIYRDEQCDGQSPWTRIASLKLPDDAPYKFISSPETVAPATGLGGVSCFALLARQSKDRNTPGSIWVLGLGTDPANRLVRRVDDSAVTGEQSVVLEPEPFVGRNEVYVYYNYYSRTSGKHGLRRASTGIKPAAAAPQTTATPASKAVVPRNESAATPLARLVFTKDYFPGSHDVSGQFMGGTEAMWLVGHNGRLFAAIGYGQDRPGTDPKPGAQVLCKDGPDTPWQVDYGFGPDCMRVEGLISFAFTTDLHSRPLTGPVSLLIASPSELTQAGGTSAVFVRSDTTGQWQRSDIAGGNLGVRSFGSHVDKVTGVHHLFAGLNRGGIHRGSYDPAAPGGIRWEPLPERTAEAQTGKGRRIYDYSRVLCFAECNGDLYMAARITTDETNQPVDGGLYRRLDGPKPSWELVYRWAIDKEVLQSRFLRGLTAVPDPGGGARQVLIANFEYPGTIVRFDPSRVGTNGLIAAEQELDIKEFFNQAWNTPTANRRGAIAAYNRFLQVTDPKSSEPLWLCGAWVERPGAGSPPNNGSCYLIRHHDGQYDWGYIYNAAHPVPAGERLTGCRDIEPSPFPGEQGWVFYFCGYDGGAGPSHNTAWIYKGTMKEQP